MQIRSCQLYRTRLRCRRPFVIASGVLDFCEGYLLRLIDESGQSGWGEAVPHPVLTSETQAGGAAALQEFYLPHLLSQAAVWPNETLFTRLEQLALSPAAMAAVDMALWDLLSRRTEVPIWALLGGGDHPIETDMSIGIETLEDTVALARQAVSDGFQVLKLKVGGEAEADVERVAAVRRTVGDSIKIRLDANGGWNFNQADRALTLMEPLDLELVEQPLPREQWERCIELRQRHRVPLAADESAHGPSDCLRLLRAGAFDIINIKLMKCGGLYRARQMVHIARAFGAGLMVGGMVGESRLAVSAAGTLAAAYRFEYADLDADLLLGESPWPREPELPLRTSLLGWGTPELSPNGEYLELLGEYHR